MPLTVTLQMGECQRWVLLPFADIDAHLHRQVHLRDPHAKRNAVQ